MRSAFVKTWLIPYFRVPPKFADGKKITTFELPVWEKGWITQDFSFFSLKMTVVSSVRQGVVEYS